MNKIKPYLFWIVAGAVIVVELIIMVLMMPDVDVVGDKKTAMDAKASLDKEYKHLKELDARAQRGVPADKYDAEKPDDINKLTNDFLVTPAWEPVLEAQVGQYDKMLSAIKSYLGNRSSSLSTPLAESADRQVWYVTYEAVTAELLRQLHSEGRIVLTPSPLPNQASQRPPTGLSLASTTEEANKDIDYASDAKAREVLGLFTKGADFPEAKDHALLTARLRAIEVVLAALKSSKVGNLANPVVASESTPSEIAQITSLKFGTEPGGNRSSAGSGPGPMLPPGMTPPPGMMPPGMMPPGMVPGGAASGAPASSSAPVVAGDDGSLELAGDIASHATGRTLTLTLQGPLSALMAAQAAIEHGNPTGPVMVVTSFALQRKTSFAIGERKGVPAEAMTAKIGILILDFTRALQAPAPVAEAPKAAAPTAPAKPAGPARPAGKPTTKPESEE
jgi:hypothetical protein